MVYPCGSSSFLKALDTIPSAIDVPSNDRTILPVTKVRSAPMPRLQCAREGSVDEIDRCVKPFLGVRAFDHVLYPRSGATVAAINALREELHAVYDITVMYGGSYDHDRQVRLPAPSMAGKDLHRCPRASHSLERIVHLAYLRGQTRELHVHIRRIPIEMIPKGGNDQIAQWLYERFVLKDK